MITEITPAPPINVLVPLCRYLTPRNSRLFSSFVIMWDELSTLLVSDANENKDLIQKSLVAENSYEYSKMKSCPL